MILDEILKFRREQLEREKQRCAPAEMERLARAALEKHKPVESEFLLDNVEALAAGESGYDTCLGSGNVTCSTGEKVECVIRPFGLD